LRNHIFHAGKTLSNIPDFKSCSDTISEELDKLSSKLLFSDNKEGGEYIKKAGSAILKTLEPLKIFITLTCPHGLSEAEDLTEERSEVFRLREISLHMSYPLRKDDSIKEELDGLQKKTDIMAFLPFFSLLSGEEIEKIASRVKLRKYEAGSVLFNEGQEAEELYVIKSGEVKIYREKGRRREDFVTLDKGDMFGEMGIITGNPRGFSAGVFSKKSEIYVIKGEDFFYILRRYPALALNLTEILCKRIDDTNKRLLRHLEDYYFYLKDREKLEKTKKKSEIIASSAFFSGLDAKEIEKISSRFKLVRYEGGTRIFDMGDYSDFLYIIKSGEVTVYKPSHKEIDKRDFARLEKGDILGEMGVISDSDRSFSARVTSDRAEIYRIGKEDFLHILRKYPELSINLAGILCKRIDETNRRLVNM